MSDLPIPHHPSSTSTEEQVWFAVYGSSLLSERFAYFLEGGTIPGLDIRHPGARDPAPPLADRALFIPHRLFFARRSPSWQRAGIAFLASTREEEAQTWGRAWLITRTQAEDLVRQLNRAPELTIDWPHLITQRQLTIGTGWYNHLLLLESDREGAPVITATSAEATLYSHTVPPGEAYLDTLIAGLIETYAIGRKGLISYLSARPGITGIYSKSELGRRWQTIINELQGDDPTEN